MNAPVIPYGCYWSTPFSRWQGSFSHLHSVEFAAHCADHFLTANGLARETIDYGLLGTTVPQRGAFYGVPWLFGRMGCDHVTGTTISQACATSARTAVSASQAVADGSAQCVMAITADRVSNGPHIYYPNPMGPGGTGRHEDWVMDNFSNDPHARVDMTTTAENCARKWSVSTSQQHDVVVQRYEQYAQALANESEFLKRFMPLPFAVPDARFRKVRGQLNGDEGIHETKREKLSTLLPVKPEGTITYAGQTHPADGNAGMLFTTKAIAQSVSADPTIEIRILAHGQARVEQAMMPAAPIPAARQALARAGLSIDQISAIKSHNPFAVNDIIFAKEMGIDTANMNNYGCSLVWGHPQAPTGMRSVIELIEELVIRGGGTGLFHGCAGGDSAMALVLSVDQPSH